MYRKVIPLLLVVLLATSSYADLGLFDVQSICKATLKNGNIIEGFILIGSGGHKKYYDTNGFYIVADNKFKDAVLFNIDFKAIEPFKGTVYTADGSHSWGSWFKNPKVYYLRDVTSRKYQYKQTEITEKVFGKNNNILKRDIIHHMEYELIEHIPIYTQLPKELYLNSENISVKPILLNVNDIERFELIREPSRHWIEQISKVENAWKKAHPDETEETMPPNWFHKIIKDEAFKDLFKPWEY